MTSIASAPAPAGPATRLRVPPNIFGIPFGIAGLAQCWANASRQDLVPGFLPNLLLILAALVWVAAVAGYTISAVRHRTLVTDLTDPITAPFMSLVLIAPLLLTALGLAHRTPGLATALIDILIALVVLHGGWFTGQLFYGEYPLAKLHPGYFLPTVAGGLVAAAAAGSVGQHRLGQVMLGYGLICWAILGSLIFARIVIGPPLPAPLLPTLAIEVAPAAVATAAWFSLNGPRIDLFTSFLAGYGALMALAQLRLLPVFVKLPFGAGTWAFTFAWGAVANIALYWIDLTAPAGGTLWSWLVLAAISILVVGIGGRTVRALAQGRYFPRQ